MISYSYPYSCSCSCTCAVTKLGSHPSVVGTARRSQDITLKSLAPSRRSNAIGSPRFADRDRTTRFADEHEHVHEYVYVHVITRRLEWAS